MARKNLRRAGKPPRADRAQKPISPVRAPHPWGDWHPVATSFHFATKDTAWADAEQSEMVAAAQTSRARTDPPPSPFKPARGRGIPLPALRRRDRFVDVLLERRTWRGFGTRPLSRTQLGALLQLTFGVQMHGRTQAGAHVVFKTSPSGGARHPIEAYVLALNVSGLPMGLYHFAPDTGRLHLVRRGASRAQLVAYLSGQWWFEDASAVVLMTAVLPRVRWRYPHPRAYRSVLLGAGHLCQTFCLVATWLKLAPFCTQALADSAIEKALDVDGMDEVVLYAAGVGSRPKNGKWVQWPAHREGRPFLPPASRRKRARPA
jgi:SagB-type dehydrogenase family enzyme